MQKAIFIVTFAMLAAVACASIDYANRGDADLGVAFSEKNYQFLSENTKTLDSVSVGEALENLMHHREIDRVSYPDILLIRDPKSFKDFLCREKILTQHVTAVIPKFPRMSLVDAVKYQEDCRESVRKLAENFYGEMVSGYGSSKERALVSANDLAKDVAVSLKNFSHRNNGDEFHVVDYLPIFYPAGGKAFIYPTNAIGRMSTSDSPDLRRAGLRHTRLIEITAIYRNFVPLLPSALTEDGLYLGKQECDPRQIMSRVNGEACWSRIFNYATSVKEAVDKDNPNVINFDISLDLDIFCKYGRPISDFISK